MKDKDKIKFIHAENEELNRLLTDSELNDKLKQLEHEYKSIKLPENLRDCVMQAVQNTRSAENDKTDEKSGEVAVADDENAGRNNRNKMAEGRKMRKKTAVYYMIRTAQTAATALLLITVLANTSAQTAYAMSQIPVLGAITKVVTFRTYEKQEGKSEAKIEIPRIGADEASGISQAADQVNKSVEEYTNQVIAKFEEELKADGKEVHRGLYSGYQVLTDNSRFFTLKIETDEIMASGYQTVKLYNIDKKTDQILELKDMFPEGTDYVTLLSKAAKEEMRKNMKEDEGKVYFLDEEVGYNFETIKEDQNFYINESGRMVLVFDEYEVAPGYMGIVELEMPKSIYQAEADN